MSPTRLTRRDAICGLLLAVAAPGALIACGSGATEPATEGADSTGAANAPGAGLAALADVPVGGGLVVDGPDGPLLLVQESEGAVTGYDASCPHAGTTVGAPSEGTIVCPNHGSQFDPATGEVLRGPAQTGLGTVAVSVEGDQVVLA